MDSDFCRILDMIKSPSISFLQQFILILPVVPSPTSLGHHTPCYQTRYIRPQLVACRLTNGDLQNSAKKPIFAQKCVQNKKSQPKVKCSTQLEGMSMPKSSKCRDKTGKIKGDEKCRKQAIIGCILHAQDVVTPMQVCYTYLIMWTRAFNGHCVLQ